MADLVPARPQVLTFIMHSFTILSNVVRAQNNCHAFILSYGAHRMLQQHARDALWPYDFGVEPKWGWFQALECQNNNHGNAKSWYGQLHLHSRDPNKIVVV